MFKLTLQSKRALFDALVFQIAWFICVLGGIKLAVLITVSNLILHLHWLKSDLNFTCRWLIYIFGCSLIGVGIDQLAIYAGFFIFPGHTLIPIWLICLWLNFMMTLHFSLYWLEKSWWLTSLLGGVGGAYSYFIGERLGQIVLPHHWSIDGLFLFLSWAILMPTFVYLKKYCLNQRKFSCIA